MRTYINKKRIGVWLPNKLFQALKTEINVYNQSANGVKLNLTKASYIMNLLYYIPLSSDEKYEDGWIPICSQALVRIKGYKRYINFLQDKDFLNKKCIEYSTSSNTCKKYKIGDAYRKHLIDFHWLEDNSRFIKKSNEIKISRMSVADDKCPHLTKWFNPELLSIDSLSALKYIRDTYIKDSQIKKKNKRIFIVKSIQNKCWSYSREGLDNRLHSIFTAIPKDLRKYVKYNNEQLISLDIKNSQPFIYASILNQIINPSINLLNNYLSNEYNTLHVSIMSDLLNSDQYNEIQIFINKVLDGTFYEHFGDILYKEGLISKDINEECYIGMPKRIRGVWVRKHTNYDNLRKVSKDVVMQILFSSEKHSSEFITVFKRHYPELYRVIQFIKKENEKNFFPVLLQNIEADCILDHCTRLISSKHPMMPLFTIHDSIVTTESYETILKEEFNRLLSIYFGLKPRLESEVWTQQFDEAG
ncbi:hypothetical protein ADIWIN_1473 [Winogradskyella psychrotolerans RS-3]|uniref:DNA-directed RNA polymerase n=1 Tax=Winogradskyella psychrotolerans RS-3 TaxID=641526 RepID=S7XBQ5_9FLAO|nr:hypothetical protein [Winogradskyella psychrotolerans]EPR73443.1 hypothetical protein ADIWIN_1473 [Winogradskyella psychrotolerans RS-3]